MAPKQAESSTTCLASKLITHLTTRLVTNPMTNLMSDSADSFLMGGILGTTH